MSASWTRVEPIEPSRYDIASFGCGRPSVDVWFHESAESSSHLVSTHLCLDDDEVIQGFFTLKTVIVAAEELPRNIARRVPGAGEPGSEATGILLAQMGLHVSNRGRDMGKDLFREATRKAVEAHAASRHQLFVTDAADDDEKLVAWYESAGLTRLGDSFRLAAPMGALVKAHSRAVTS